MATLTIQKTWNVNGVPTDPTSMTLTVVENDNSAVIASGVAMAPVTVGVPGIWGYVLSPVNDGVSYTVTIDVVYNGITYPGTPEVVTPESESATTTGYAVRSDLENIFGIPNIIKWAILSANDPTSTAGMTEITNRINWAISVATMMFDNAMREGRYALPVTGAEASVWATTVVATLAGLLLYQHLKPTQRDQDGRPIPDKYDGIFHLGRAAAQLRQVWQAPPRRHGIRQGNQCTVYDSRTQSCSLRARHGRIRHGAAADGAVCVLNNEEFPA